MLRLHEGGCAALGRRHQRAGIGVPAGHARPRIELAGERKVRLFTSRALLDEPAATLAKPKLAKHVVAATGLTPERMLALYRRLAGSAKPRPLERPVARDADDDAVLACALAARADAIVSGDDDLLSLGSSEGILILSAARAVEQLQRPTA